jgi:membrane-associated phospholipid phosphatase
MRTGAILTLLILFVFTEFELNAQNDYSSKRFLTWMVQDPVVWAKNIDQDQLTEFGVSSFILGSIFVIDQSSSNFFQTELKHSKYLSVTNEFGNRRYAAPASIVIFSASLLTNNHKFQDAAFTSFQSILYTQLTVSSAKWIFGRQRPHHGGGPYDFEFFENSAKSFPSGHTASAFALFTPWAVYYPNVFTYSLLVIPMSTGIARIAKGEHWLTDVTAGALVGAYWGYYLSRQHIDWVNQQQFNIIPHFNGEGGGITLGLKF